MRKETKQEKRDKIFDRFMEENFPFIYKLNELGYEMKKKGGQTICQKK